MQVKQATSGFWLSFIALLISWSGQAWSQTLQWLPLGNTPRAIYGSVGGAHSGNWIVAGGYANSTTWTITGDAHLWSEGTSTWSSANAMPIPVTLAAAVALDGKLYVMGGHNTSNQIENRVQVYDFATGTWSVAATMPRKRRAAVAVVLNEFIYLMGGTSDGATASASVDRFNPASGTWEAMPNLPNGRSHLAATVAAGRIHVMTGFTGCTGCVHNDHWRWAPGEAQWQTLAAAPTRLLGAVAFTDDAGHVVLTGGSTYSTDSSSTWVFDGSSGATGAWSATTSLSGARREPLLVVSSSKFAVIGGIRSGQLLNDAEGVVRQGETTVPPGTPVLAIPESDLAAAVGPLDIYEQTSTVFLSPDPLGAEGISFENARANLSGAGLRLSQVSVGDQKYFLDFLLNPNSQFGLAQIGTEPSGRFQGLPLTGLDTTRTVALVSGPPLRVLATPVLVNGSPVTISLALNAQASLDIEAVTSLSADALAFFSTQAPVASANARATTNSITVDSYIARQTRLDRSLPSGTDWNNAVLKCITNGIDSLKVDGFNAKMLQMVGASAPRIAQDVRFHLALGRPADASLVMSEWAFKALAEGASSGNEFGDLFKLISKNSSYGRALAAGAGACTVDYKEGLKVMLTGMANKLFPYGSCFAGLSMQAGLQARNWLNNEVVETIYQGWRNHGDDVFTYGSVKGIDGLIGYVASQMPPGKNPYRVTDTDRAVATEQLKKTFREWQTAESSSSTIKDHLNRMKTRFQSDRFRQLIGEDALRRSLARANTASEADVFARYVEMMQRTRARLSPFAQSSMTDDQIDDAAEVALAEYLNRGPAAWRTAIAKQLQSWDPEKFASEPPVCSMADNPEILSISLNYQLSQSPFDATCYSDASFLKPSYSFVLNRTTSQQNGGNIAHTGNGQFTATCTTSRCNPSITCSGSTQTTAGTPTATLACTTKHGTLPVSFTLTGPIDVSTAPITHKTGTYTVPVNGASGPNAKPVPCVAPLTVLGTVSFRSQ